jgi:hydroxyethylthiazole kinase-like uncharacterized protein yjeF
MRWGDNEILGVADHAALDELAVASGVAIETLMENAGRAVANEIERWNTTSPRKPITVLCGPGNNGGDGFVVARHLQARCHPVEVLTVGDGSRASPAALAMRAAWRGPIRPWVPGEAPSAMLVVDAVYGAGLTRAIPVELSEYFGAAMNVVAVDVPSGLHGDRALFLGDHSWNARRTVTFVRKKPAHVLMPGKAHCGPVTVCDIGMPRHLIRALAEAADEGALDGSAFARENTYLDFLPEPATGTHKYDRGHCLAVMGPALATGAARLAARAAFRVGAGLVTLAGDPQAALVCAHHVTAEIVRSFEGAAGLRNVLSDKRINSIVIGPGLGRGEGALSLVATVLASEASVVLDADALSSFEGQADALFGLIRAKPGAAVVMTPHDGEFERLFPGLRKRAVNKIEAARMAAEISGAVVVLKGPDTVIAHPQGLARVNTMAPPWLATAGSGDVLAGLVAGLLAQGVPGLDAACLAVETHSLAGAVAGRGLIATDLLDAIAEIRKNPGLVADIAL